MGQHIGATCMANTSELSVCCGDAALCQIALTTCCNTGDIKCLLISSTSAFEIGGISEVWGEVPPKRCVNKTMTHPLSLAGVIREKPILTKYMAYIGYYAVMHMHDSLQLQ